MTSGTLSTERINPAAVSRFQRTVMTHYRDHGRDLPWRRTTDPYAVMVSELMLQQTQVDRVIPKFLSFLERFPDPGALADARLADVIALWQGLGYNRRAKFLFEAAKVITEKHGGVVPDSEAELKKLPGIGPYTAAAITAFAFDRPAVVIDTNIRRVYIHEFFRDAQSVTDADIIPLIEATMLRDEPRNWFNALMDFGAMIVREHGNANRKSASYMKQSKFEGSDRQIRGLVLKALVADGTIDEESLSDRIGIDNTARVSRIAEMMLEEGIIARHTGTLSIP